ncbi:MAG: response regulator transcription factor [Roseiflexaceae bacterium]
MATEPIRILIVDDQELIRRGLKIILDQQPDMVVVGQASDGEHALQLVRSEQPQLVLMDLKMPRMGGAQATRTITTEFPEIQVVVLTTYDTDDLVFDAVRAGAQAYVLKDTSSEDLLDVIRGVHQGESRLDPAIARKVMNEFRRISGPLTQAPTIAPAETPAEMPSFEHLTEREAEILALIAQGKSNREIGAELFLSEGTVKNYVSRTMAKLHANDRTQLILTALRAGIVQLTPPRSS